MPTYILGRDQVADIPGVDNDDIKRVTIRASGTENDITVFTATALTTSLSQVSLVDVSVECVCTHHTAAVGDDGDFEVADIEGVADWGVHLHVSDIRMNVTPKGMKEYTISYVVAPAPPAP